MLALTNTTTCVLNTHFCITAGHHRSEEGSRESGARSYTGQLCTGACTVVYPANQFCLPQHWVFGHIRFRGRPWNLCAHRYSHPNLVAEARSPHTASRSDWKPLCSFRSENIIENPLARWKSPEQKQNLRVLFLLLDEKENGWKDTKIKKCLLP